MARIIYFYLFNLFFCTNTEAGMKVSDYCRRMYNGNNHKTFRIVHHYLDKSITLSVGFYHTVHQTVHDDDHNDDDDDHTYDDNDDVDDSL